MKYLFWISVKVNRLLEFGLNQGKELFTKRSSFKNDSLLILSCLLSIITVLIVVVSPPFIFGWLLTAIGVPFKVMDLLKFLSFFVWIWILSLQKTRDQTKP